MRLRRPSARLLVALLLAAPVVAGVVIGLSPAGTGHRPLELPSQVLVAPGVSVADLHGRPAIVHYWASWCGPCDQEAPELARLAAHLGGRARLIGVDFSDDRSAALKFVRRHGWTFPNLVDAGGATGRSSGVRGLPATLIVDAQGQIVRRLVGAQTEAGLLRAVG